MPPKKNKEERLSGPQKAAALIMSLEEDIAAKLFAMMTEEEIKEVSQVMSTLGTIEPEAIEGLMHEFTEEISSGKTVTGSLENVEKILVKALGKERVDNIMEEITGPLGRNTWEKLNNVSEEVLASFLKNEYPQTVALVLSKVRTAQAARVLSVLPDDYALEVIQRMLTLEPVKREVIQGIEKTLQAEFMSNLSSSKKQDSFEIIAEVFNNFDRNTENKFMEILDKADPQSAERIRELMFTFDDLATLDGPSIQTLLRKIDKDKLPVALKGSNETIRKLFFDNMSERAVKILKEDMDQRGPVRMKEVDEAQKHIVSVTKDLAQSGEIVIPDGNEEEQMVY